MLFENCNNGMLGDRKDNVSQGTERGVPCNPRHSQEWFTQASPIDIPPLGMASFEGMEIDWKNDVMEKDHFLSSRKGKAGDGRLTGGAGLHNDQRSTKYQ